MKRALDEVVDVDTVALQADAKAAHIDGADAAVPAVVAVRDRVMFQTFGGALVWSIDDIVTLRANHINGDLIGSDPLVFSQHCEHDTPLALFPEEIATACHVLGVPVPPSHRVDTLRSRVVHELWTRGYWIGRGANFGADFVAYEANPQVYHAVWLVVVKEWDAAMSCKALAALARLASTVKKHAIIGTQHPDTGKIVLIRFRWRGV